MSNDPSYPNRSRAKSIFSADLEPPVAKPKAAPVKIERNKTSSGWVFICFLVFGAAGFACVEMKDEVAPYLSMIGIDLLPTPAVVVLTSQQNGDVLTAQMKMDDGHEALLCDQVMEEIYSLANKNPTALHLQLAVQIAGKSDVSIHVDDLDAVRKYRTQNTYANSGHRSFVGSPLVDAGLIGESSLAVDESAHGDDDVIGNFYQSTSGLSPCFGVKFLDESNVELYASGVPYARCHYSIEGDTVVIPTSCNTVRLRRQGDGFADELMNDDHLAKQ